MRTREIAEQLRPELVALRRELHQIPEIGLHLPLTQRRVLDELADLDLEITTGTDLSSVVAVVRGRGPAPQGREDNRPVVLLRGDMDALPVTEELEHLPYRSTHEGQMHACGHDLHTAALIGAARILDQMRDDLAGDVVLMFQPAEEGPGGAEPMLAEGLLDAAGRPVEAAYAMHVSSSEFPLRQWYSCPGPIMAAADTVHIEVTGMGGHGSQPQFSLDPVPVLCEIVLAMHTMVTRSFDPFDTVVLTVGRIEGGTKDNIIGDTANLSATLRTFSAETRELALANIERIATHVAAAHGQAARMWTTEAYPATINDPAEYELARTAAQDLFGPEQYADRPAPEMGSEDMSFVLNKVPGAYFFVSACPAEDYVNAPTNHSPRAEFDDVVVPDAAAWYAEVALRRTAQG
ncbi:M20 metallopeptidase family protein [Ornithinimicrobium faecis]|uniref:M20 family metallopeptidase n=1 Tax=Ornithinimicrobium faecis TaxID=2934158 RepID=A0ABY4YTW1_9MICO|nr:MULTISPECIES: M20 family metallopeptidase [unclassified Ornithinimicrobium]USQ79905.1 M20 family metallopeptidase [Ornithinimicrobium sp. HY1793]